MIMLKTTSSWIGTQNVLPWMLHHLLLLLHHTPVPHYVMLLFLQIHHHYIFYLLCTPVTFSPCYFSDLITIFICIYWKYNNFLKFILKPNPWIYWDLFFVLDEILFPFLMLLLHANILTVAGFQVPNSYLCVQGLLLTLTVQMVNFLVPSWLLPLFLDVQQLKIAWPMT